MSTAPPSPPAASSSPAAMPPRAAGNGAAADGSESFAALLAGDGAQTNADADAARLPGDEPAKEAGDDEADAAPVADDACAVDWLLTLRQSLALTAPPPEATPAPAPMQVADRGAASKAGASSPPPDAATHDAPSATTHIDDTWLVALASATMPTQPVDAAGPSGAEGLPLPPPVTLPAVDAGAAIPAMTLPPPPAIAAHAASAAPAAASAPPPLSVPPDHPDFIDGLGERIVWITDGGLDHARIELHPAELGALSVQVQIRGDEARIAFSAEQPATRALLQNAVPQLRELLGAQGLQLMRAQIDARVTAPRGADTHFDAPQDGRAHRDGRAPARRVSRVMLVDAYV